jgi:hypothetical protein
MHQQFDITDRILFYCSPYLFTWSNQRVTKALHCSWSHAKISKWKSYPPLVPVTPRSGLPSSLPAPNTGAVIDLVFELPDGQPRLVFARPELRPRSLPAFLATAAGKRRPVGGRREGAFRLCSLRAGHG